MLFQHAPSDTDLAQLHLRIANRIGRPFVPSHASYDRIHAVEDADLVANVCAEGELQYLSRPRPGALSNVPFIQGRLHHIQYVTCGGSEHYPEGPVMDYALTVLCLLSRQDVQGVWYTDDTYRDGVTLQAMTHHTGHALIDPFIAIGKTLGGKPV